MIVDNEPNMIEEIKSSLNEDDYKIIVANNNREALEHMGNSDEEKVNLILVNTKLPDSRESALFSMKPISRMNIDTCNIMDYLQKPFTKEQLLDFVKRRIDDI